MTSAVAPPHAPHAAPWLVVVPALLAAAVSLYLTVTSLAASSRPLGCGTGSGCEEVLTSRWSQVLGVPVGLPAAGLYLATAVLAVLSRKPQNAGRITHLSRLLWLCAGTILAAVHWFIGLQWLDLGAFCPWCLFDHALGAWTALAVLAGEVRAGRFRPLSFLGGMGLTAVVAAAQIVFPGSGPAPAALSADQVESLQGQLPLDLAEAPRLGSGAAPPVVVLFDYCCPHCRQTHAWLLAWQARVPEAFSVVLLPTPLNVDCNPHVEETEPRFVAACALARLALAVWRAAPERFAEFDRWLFESEQPRSQDAARGEAERLVGADALRTTLADPWIERQLRAHVDAFAASGVDAIPVLLAPGRGGVSGRVSDAAALEALLRDTLGVALPAP